MAQEFQNLLESLMQQDFVGGTFVEYKNGYGFDVEFRRGTITHFLSGEDKLIIMTSSPP